MTDSLDDAQSGRLGTGAEEKATRGSHTSRPGSSQPGPGRDNGILEDADIRTAPLEEGRDPLGDKAPSVARRSTARIALLIILVLGFGLFLINDVLAGRGFMSVLGLFVVALCAYLLVVEMRKPKN